MEVELGETLRHQMEEMDELLHIVEAMEIQGRNHARRLMVK